MSMFVGAVMPRQETAFASEERKINPPAKQVMAVQINRRRRICFVRGDIKYANATLSSRLSQGAEFPANAAGWIMTTFSSLSAAAS
jgi:hypothetical protein